MFRPMTSSVSALSGIVANGHQAIHVVSSAPSKIPYGGFSPVRLQASLQNATFRSASALRYRRLQSSSGVHPLLCPVAWACAPSERAGHRLRRTRPVALGSASGFALRQPPRLLWPHPSFCTAPPVSCFIADGSPAVQKVPTFICQSLLTCRRPYSEGSTASGTNLHAWPGLRPIGRGSATLSAHTPDTVWRSYEAATFTYRCGPPARLPRSGRDFYDRACLPVDHSLGRSVITTGTFVSFLTGLAPAALAALWAAHLFKSSRAEARICLGQ
jgi:hypothetical protein